MGAGQPYAPSVGNRATLGECGFVSKECRIARQRKKLTPKSPTAFRNTGVDTVLRGRPDCSICRWNVEMATGSDRMAWEA